MLSFRHSSLLVRLCAGLALGLFASAGPTAVTLRAADAEPDPTPPVERPDPPAAPAEPAEPAPDPTPTPTPVPSQAPLRRIHRDVAVGIFQDVHLRAHEVAEHVVAIFGDARVEGEVQDNAVVIFGRSEVDGEVGGNLVSIFGSTRFTERVDGNAVGVFSEVFVEPGASVDGNLVSIGGPAHLDDAAQVHGQVVTIPIPGLRHLGTWVREDLLLGRLYAHDRRGTWIFIGVMLALTLLIAAMFRGPVEAGVSVMARRPAGAFINGILGAIIVPPAIFLLVATGIGVFILPFAWLGIAFGTAVGVIALYRYCGAQIGFGHQPAAALIAGFLIFAVIYMLPVVGFLAWATVMMFGFGVALTAWGETRREKRAAELARRRAASTAAAAAAAAAPNPAPRNYSAAPPAPSAPAPATPLFTLGEPLEAPPQNPPPVAGVMPAGDIAEASTGAGAPSGFAPAPGASAGTPPGAATPPPAPPAVPAASASAAAGQMALLDQERADFLPRFAATLLDLITVVAAVNFLRLEDYFVQVWFLYHLGFWAWRATTLGGAVMGLRIVRLDGRKVDVGVALVRVLGAVMSLLPFGLGFLWVFWDSEKQSWHDKIAGTVIVRHRRGQALI